MRETIDLKYFIPSWKKKNYMFESVKIIKYFKFTNININILYFLTPLMMCDIYVKPIMY